MSRDHRSSFRFPLPAGQDQAALRIGHRTETVRIVNASATGFLLEAPQLDAVAGDVLVLTTAAAHCEIRVAFAETEAGQTKLGVERIRDLDEPATCTISLPWYSLLVGNQQSAGSPGSIVIAVATLALLVAGSLFLTQNLSSSPRPSTTPHSLARWFSDKLASIDRQARAAIQRLAKPPSTESTSSEAKPRAVAAPNRASPVLTTKQPQKSKVARAP